MSPGKHQVIASALFPGQVPLSNSVSRLPLPGLPGVFLWMQMRQYLGSESEMLSPPSGQGAWTLS